MISQIHFKVLLVVICTLCISCNNETEEDSVISESDFQETEHLESIAPDIENADEFFDPRFIDVSDSLLIVLDNTNSDIFKFYRLDDFSLVGTFGNQGEGPGEISFPAFINHGGFKADEEFEFLDWGRKTISRYSLDQVLNNDQAVPIFEYMLPPDLIRIQRGMFIENGKYIIGLAGMREGKLAKVDTKTDSIVAIAPFTPFLEEAINHRSVGLIYSGEMTANEEKQRILVTTRRFKILEIFDYDLNLIRDTRFEANPGTGSANEIVNTTEETLYHYNDVTYTDSLIYTLHEGNTSGNYIKGESLNDSEIHVFDWDGNPVKKYKVDIVLSQIAIDKNNNRIIGLPTPFSSKSVSDSPLVYFEL
ncbi:BF3164 family lipoprotein [Gracilimonas sp.]|uniref:BF3164 family lipoprotein n=1 Tax=Gracilimonas sp. TaxID=1974203 RepID=UPI00287131C9|nr:BF3164 family lipoprotein [Gracilimonas sp.]